MRWLLLSGCLFTLHSTAVTNCTLTNSTTAATAMTIAADSFLVAYRFEPASPSIGAHFSLRGRVCRKDGEQFRGSIKANATMPRHGHGMNYRPSVEMLSRGEFSINGLLLHMPGLWLFQIQLIEGALRERVRFEHTAK